MFPNKRVNKVQNGRVKSIVENLYDLEQEVFELDYKLQLKTYGGVGKKEATKKTKKKLKMIYETLSRLIDTVNKI